MGRRYQRLKNTAETTTAIIAGSGPSIDSCDTYLYEKIQKYCPVFAVNAAVIKFRSQFYRNTNWVFKNMSAFTQTRARCAESHLVRIFTRQQNWTHVLNYYKKNPYKRTFDIIGFHEDQGEAYSKHTTGTAAARVAHHIGHRRLVLLGMDFTPMAGKPYAVSLEYQRCIYETPDKQEVYFRNFETDWQILKDELTDTEIINCSPVSKDRVFPYRPFKEVFEEIENENTIHQ